MKRDTKIVLGAVASIPTVILSLSALCTWAIAHGASMKWRLVFRTLCHGKPERCLYLFNVPMPICARCAGIYAGVLAGLALFGILPWLRERTMRMIAFAALTPLALDGLTQLTGLRESTNPLRIGTGLVAGLAFGLWVLSAVERQADTKFTAP
ncbi:MAG TPA: DUF2085 domain-containing protein [Thermoanaerobaculia bacterium]|jgi:uncharacterized membrane protein